MKKLSFFLMAMLMSVMSFAQVVTFSPANETAVESQEFTLTSGDVTLVCSSGTITADQFRFFKNQTVTISSTGGNIVSVEFTCTASGTTKYGPGCFTTTSGDYTYAGKVGTWTGEANEVKFTASSNQVRATQVVVTLLVAGAVPQPSIQGATDFIESTEVSIVASEGLKVYYTLDGTDPTTESTEYTAPFTVEETTTVKAIAHDGTNASDITETTFTKATKVTCAEAAEIASQLSDNNVLSDLYYVVVGYVTELDGTISNGQQKFWVSDTKGGANTLYSYWCNVPQELVVGDYIQMFGKLTKYYEKNQMKYGDVTILEEPAPEPEYMVVEDKINNFVFDTEAWPMVCYGGPSAEYGVEVYLVLTEDEDADGTLDYDQCSVSIQGQDVTFIDGTLSNIDPYTPSADAVLHVQKGEEYFELHLAMAGAPATVTEIVLTDAIVAINEDLGTLTFNVPTDEGEGYYAELAGYTAPGVHEGPQICLFMTPEAVAYTNYAETSVADGVITLTGEFATADGSAKFNVTISGKLPVVEPAGVTYNVTVPEGTYACYIAGEMNGWGHTEMTKVDDTHYTITIEDATTAMKYKYCSGPDWKYVEKDANGNDVLDRTYAENDVVASWAAIYNPNPTVEPETTWTVAGAPTAVFGTEWDPTNVANDMTLQNDGTYKWEKKELIFAAGDPIGFKVVKNHAWTEAYPSANYELTIDESGIYTLTITFNPATTDVAAVATKTGDAEVEVEISYVLMGVQNDWETGIALTRNEDNTETEEYMLLGQEILEGDAVKVVTLRNGVKSIYCDKVDEASPVEYEKDGDNNIVLKPGKYDFYYKVAENIIYIGGEAYPEVEVIAYELNGGVLPAPAVPTNAELWGTDTADVNGFMHYFNHYHNLKRSAQDISADLSTNPVATFLTGMPDEAGVFVDEESKYKWLGDYIVKVTNDQIAEGKLSVLKAVDTNVKWRYGVQAFFMCLPATDSNYKGWADFTEAGKPEAWGAAYQAANELVLPTEPVAEDYVLPTPTKEGYIFVGWYDNAEGAGEAYKVIPAGWAGTLYAIWTPDAITALENIAVEGKAVKAIINGQLIIIKNGVQYNAQGQVVK